MGRDYPAGGRRALDQAEGGRDRPVGKQLRARPERQGTNQQPQFIDQGILERGLARLDRR
jgi:hypothetical protein